SGGAGAEAAQHAGVGEAHRAGRGLGGGALRDEVLGAFQPQLLLVPQRGEAGRGGEAAGEGAFADADRGGQVRQRQGAGVGGVDDVLGAVDGVAEVAAVPQHDPRLGLVAVAARVHDHGAGHAGGGAGAVADGEQVQRQVDAAGDPRGGDHAAVGDVQHVADDGGAGVAAGEVVLQLVVGGAAASVQQPGVGEGE